MVPGAQPIERATPKHVAVPFDGGTAYDVSLEADAFRNRKTATYLMEWQVVQSLVHVARQHRLVRLYHIFPQVICLAWASMHVTDSSDTIVQRFCCASATHNLTFAKFVSALLSHLLFQQQSHPSLPSLLRGNAQRSAAWCFLTKPPCCFWTGPRVF